MTARAGAALLALMSLAGGCGEATPVEPASHPGSDVDLVVLLVIDQVPQPRWFELLPRFREDGFRRLAREGRSYDSAFLDYATSLTAVSHAALVTGQLPSAHGIVANEWMDRATGRRVYSVGERSDPSPETLLVPTLGDLLVERSHGASRVVAVSIKDRASVILAGRRGTALWYDPSSGHFRVRTSDGRQPPGWSEPWLAGGERNVPADRYLAQEWTLLGDTSSYASHCPETAAGCPDADTAVCPEVDDAGSFPKSLPPGKAGYVRLRDTPMGDRMTLDLALAALREEHLGHNGTSAPDLLAISLSATDYIGHRYGPDSVEYEDQLLHADTLLAELLDALDREVGLARTAMVLTSDHGTDSATAYHRYLGRPTGRLLGVDMVPEINRRLRERFGYDVDLVGGFFTPGFFLDPRALESRRLDRGVVADQVAELVGELPGVGSVYVGSAGGPQLRAGEPRWYDELVARSFHPQRSGDGIVVPQAHVYLGRTGEDVAMHGTPYPYDGHVPLVLIGPGIAPGTHVGGRVAARRVAPTLAAMIGIDAQAGWLPALP